MNNQTGLYTPNCIRTISGEFIDVVNIKPNQVQANDIAIGLARACRFNGFTKKWYCVADHAVWCMKKGRELYPTDTALHFKLLNHDDHEAYLADWPTPLINSINGYAPGFKEIIETVKRIVQAAIDTRFGISGSSMDDDRVRLIDKMALEYEWENKVLSWTGYPPLSIENSASIWLNYFEELVKVPVVAV